MTRKLLLFIACALLLLLCGCGTRIDEEGALKLSEEQLKTGKVTLLDEEQYKTSKRPSIEEGEELVETIWTLRKAQPEKGFLWFHTDSVDFDFHIANYYYLSGIDATELVLWDVATDYEFVLFQKAVDDGYIVPNWEDKEESLLWGSSREADGRKDFTANVRLIYCADSEEELRTVISSISNMRDAFLRWKHDHGLLNGIYSHYRNSIRVQIVSGIGDNQRIWDAGLDKFSADASFQKAANTLF